MKNFAESCEPSYQVLNIENKVKLTDLIEENNKMITSMLAYENYIFIGNSLGFCRLYNHEKQSKIKSYYISELEAFKDRAVLSMDISEDGNLLICGYANGHVVVWETYSTKCKKVIEDSHTSPVVKIKYLKGSIKNLKFLSSEASGKVFLNEVSEGMFFTSADFRLLISESSTVFQLDTLKIPSFAKSQFSEDLVSSEIFGLCTLNDAKVYRIYPKIKRLLHVPKPDEIDSTVLPDIAFGLKPNGVTSKCVLVVSWGTTIRLFTFQEELFEFLPSNFLEHSATVLRIGFLSPAILFVFDAEKEFSIINIQSFCGSQTKSRRSLLFSTKAKSFTKQLISREIQFQSILFDKGKQVKKASYTNTIVPSGVNFMFYGKRELYCCKLFNWEKSLRYTFDEGDWYQAFLLGIDLFKGNTTGLAGIEDTKEFREIKVKKILEDLIEQYACTCAGTVNKDNLLKKDQLKETISSINVCIEFLLELNSVDILMNVVHPSYDLKGYGEIFIHQMEPFILSNKLKGSNLSQATLSKILSLYQKKGKYLILNQMLCHFDVNQIEYDFLKKTCEEHSLVSALFHIYSNGKERDYFRPLGLALKAFDEAEESPFESYHGYLVDSNVDIVGLFGYKDFYGHKLFEYINCLTRGFTFMNLEQISQGEHLNLCIKLLYWLCCENNFLPLISFDTAAFLKQIEHILKVELIGSILQEKGCLEVLTEDGSKYSFKIDDLIQRLKQFKLRKDRKANCHLSNFIVTLSCLFPGVIESSVLVESAIFLMQNNPHTHIGQYTDFTWDVDYIESTSAAISEMLIRNDSIGEAEKDELLQGAALSPFNLLQVDLYDEKKEYIAALKCFLTDDAKFSIKNRATALFKWISKTLNDLVEDAEDSFEEFREEILLQLPLLAQVEPYSTSVVIDNWFKNRQTEAINYLNESPELQLKYIEKIIEKDGDKIERAVNGELGDMDQSMYYLKILKKHIKLLCIYKKSKVVEVLRSSTYYPLDECLKKCVKYKAYDAAIFIHQKVGEINEAINLSIRIAKETFLALIAHLEGTDVNESFYETNKVELGNQVEQAILICENNSKEIRDEENETWFLLVDEVYALIKEIKPVKQERVVYYSDLREMLSNKVKDILERMCSYVKMKDIMNV